MGAPVLAKRRYRFGLFSADAESGRLLREGIRVKLQDQPFRLLCMLLEHAGSVVEAGRNLEFLNGIRIEQGSVGQFAKGVVRCTDAFDQVVIVVFASAVDVDEDAATA